MGRGPYVVEEGTYAGTHTGSYLGRAPTKKKFVLHELTVVELRDGKIANGWTYGNDLELESQLFAK